MIMLLEPGDHIRYQGLGAGQVIRHAEREFQGKQRVFAVISFPHRDMTVQLPVGDPAVTKKLQHVMKPDECEKLIASLSKSGKRLARTWDQREDSGNAILKQQGPAEWVALLQSYTTARKEGFSVSASDAHIVREAQALVAAELCASCGVPFEQALARVEGFYTSVERREPSKRGDNALSAL
jgi:RNA polymerase-interacting CarD/CdnL/TRCF family regulator